MSPRLSLVSLFAALLCVAQTSTYTLTGTIYDNSGAVVAGAIVTVANDATGVAQKQLANSAGLFAFLDRGGNIHGFGGNGRFQDYPENQSRAGSQHSHGAVDDTRVGRQWREDPVELAGDSLRDCC